MPRLQIVGWPRDGESTWANEKSCMGMYGRQSLVLNVPYDPFVMNHCNDKQHQSI